MAFNLEMLITALANTMNEQLEPRQQAETYLDQASCIQGFVPFLLKISVDTTLDVPPHVRQSACVYLKNTIARSWKERPPSEYINTPPFVIPQEDKVIMKETTISALIFCDENTLKSLCYCIELISKNDFPKRWPGLLQKLKAMLESDSPQEWNASVLTLYQVGRKYQYKPDNERAEYLGVIQTLIPILFARCSQLLHEDSPLSCNIQRFIMKTIYYLVHSYIPTAIFNDNVLHQWIPYLLAVLSKPLPPDANSIPVDDLPSQPIWKCKKWAIKVLYQITGKFIDVDDKKYVNYKKFYTEHYAVKVVEQFLQLLDAYSKGAYCTPIILQMVLLFLSSCVCHSVSWKIMSQHFEAIFISIVFPLMCHSEKDATLWEEDPCEYIRIKFDIFDDFLSSVSSAETLIQQAVEKRKGVLENVLSHCMRFLTTTNGNPEESAKQVDGALHVIAVSCTSILEHSEYHKEVENLFIRFVFPLFTSPVPYLRARACWMFHSFQGLKLTSAENSKIAVEGLVNCVLNEKELPVRVESAISLVTLLGIAEHAEELLKPYIKFILREFLNLIRESESDEISEALREVISTYGEDISDIALDLCNSLVQTFTVMYNVNKPNEELDESDLNKSLAVMGLLNSIYSLLCVSENQFDLLLQLEDSVRGLLITLLSNEVMDFYEEVFQILEKLTDEQISPNMWGVLPIIYESFHRDAFDYFSNIMPVLYNYISVDEAVFLSNPEYIKAIITMCKKTMDESNDDQNSLYACKLLEIILLNLKGKVDDWLPNILQPPMLKLTQNLQSPELRIQCLIVCIAAIFTSPIPTLGILESTCFPNCPDPITYQLFKQWIENPDEFEGIHDRKISILALCVLIECPLQVPALITIAPQILSSLIKTFMQLISAYEIVQQAEENEENSDQEAESDLETMFNRTAKSDDVDICDDDDDDDDDEDDEDYDPKSHKSHKNNSEEGTSDVSSDDEGDSLSKTSIESEFETLIEVDSDYDEFIWFRATFERIKQNNPQWFSTLTQLITPEMESQLRIILEHSVKKEQEQFHPVQAEEQPANSNASEQT